MTLDFFATFFAGSMSLLPIFADRILLVGPAGYGWLRAAPGIGALVSSVWTSVVGLPRRQGRVFLWAVAAYGAVTIVFGLSRNFALTFAALALVGLTDTISTVVRQTVRQLVTPDALRGRMTGVNMIFFMGGPQLGELEAGFLASLFVVGRDRRDVRRRLGRRRDDPRRGVRRMARTRRPGLRVVGDGRLRLIWSEKERERKKRRFS